MASNTEKVSDIMTEAGTAFTKLGELAVTLQNATDSSQTGKWTSAELDMFYDAIRRFSTDLQVLSDLMKAKTTTQIKEKMKSELIEGETMKTEVSTSNEGGVKESADVEIN